VAVFFLPQTPVERQAEEEVQQAGYPLVAESTQAAPTPLLLLVAVGAEVLQPALRAVERRPPLSDELLKPHRVQSKNTNGAAAGKLKVSVALALVSGFVAYPAYDDGPGTPFNASLLISNEIL
jgi:hypothetical protein